MEVGTGWSGWSGTHPDCLCLPLLIFPCTTESRSSGWSWTEGRKTVVVVGRRQKNCENHGKVSGTFVIHSDPSRTGLYNLYNLSTNQSQIMHKHHGRISQPWPLHILLKEVGLAATNMYPCGKCQTMSHIVNSCPQSKLEGAAVIALS